MHERPRPLPPRSTPATAVLATAGLAMTLAACLTGCQNARAPFDAAIYREVTEVGQPNGSPATAPREPLAAQADESEDDAFLDSPLELSIERAVLLTLRNNRGLRAQQLQPAVAATFEQLERAVFDPVVEAEVSGSFIQREQYASALDQDINIRNEAQFAGIGLQQRLPTGTDVGVSLSAERLDTPTAPGQYAVRPGLTLTQALLRGASPRVNNAFIERARLDTRISEYELRGFTEALVAEVEFTFWEYLYADLELNIFERSLGLAQQQLNETRRRVEVGTVAATELAAARAEVAQRTEDLINARSNKERLGLRLVRLIAPDTQDAWDLELGVVGQAESEVVPLSPVREHVELAEQLRPELNEARLLLDQGRLEVIRTRDGLLPRLDLFVTLGKTGYARSFGEAWRNIDADGYDLAAGLRFAVPIGNRAAAAGYDRARFSRQQASESLRNLTQLVRLDVREAYLEVQRAREQIEATRATRQLREEALRAETEKFGVGTSTAFLVAQAQRDLLESQIAEVRAMVNYRQALIDLYRADGSLLLRRAIRAPGDRAYQHEPLRMQ